MNKEITPARTRLAPSPTGRTHLGTARTALYDFLLSQQTGGQFVLRIEDTDQKRYVPGAEEELKIGLRWLGLYWDEGPDVGGPYEPYKQSKRKEIYQKYAKQLIESDHAYYCFCTPERLEKVRKEQIAHHEQVHYDGKCRDLDKAEAERRVANGEDHVIRFKMPKEGTITVRDRLRGEITFENKNLEDYIIVKSDGLALYHLAAMVDDHLMKITHVIRSAEWLSTFPLHAHIIRALGWNEPEWVHVSVFLNPSGKGKMSKRDAPQLMDEGYSIFLGDLQGLGYIPEAVVNWIALMGWSYDDKTEFFTMEELIEKFDIDKCNPAPASINFSKLDHFNGLHIRNLKVEDLAERVKPFLEKDGYIVDNEILLKAMPLLQPRLTTLKDVSKVGGFFFVDEIKPEPQFLIGKKMTEEQSIKALKRVLELLEGIQVINHETAEQKLRTLAKELGVKAGQVFGLMRSAVTGQEVSPPLFETMDVIGREKSLERIADAIQILEHDMKQSG